jgi:ABC-type spermidine/putrescine transport system permease subunit I
VVLYGGLFVLPVLIVFKMSVDDGLGNFAKILSSPVFRRVTENTIVTSAMTTALAIVFGYLIAALLWRTDGWKRSIVLGFVLLPFWTSLLIKNFAWAFLLQSNGVINNLLIGAGLISEPLPLLHNRFAVVLGMLHFVLPYAIFPIYTSMLAIDTRLERAARSLGASGPSVLVRITLPLCRRGIYGAALLVFIICTSFYVTPVILGSPAQMMVANLVQFYTSTLVDFGSAAALSIIIFVAAGGLISVYMALPKEGQHG